MELLLIKLIALVRPLASIDIAGDWFDVLGVGLFAFAVASILVVGAARKTLRFSGIDATVIALSVWAFAIYLTYIESAQLRYVAKFVIPVLCYTVVKNVLRDVREYRQMVLLMLVGTSIPAVWSAIAIAMGSSNAVDMVNYWTGVARWRGVYNHSHTLGHIMTLFVMTMVVYVALRATDGDGEKPKRMSLLAKFALGSLGLVALYCLYMSQVRTALLGLIVFAGAYTFLNRRKLFFLGSAGFAVLALLTFPFWFAPLLPELAGKTGGASFDMMELGSDRPKYWLHDIVLFADLPLDRKLAGVGIGTGDPADGKVVTYTTYGHNDWLDMLTQTGLVGFALFALLQYLLFRAVLRLPRHERYVFLPIFIAVNVMMFVSNSYAFRIQVSQLYIMLMAYVELPLRRAQEQSVAVGRVGGGLIAGANR